MLSYRHAFHAGNHADVLKHLVSMQLLRYMMRKEKPISYIDTHAGAGAYLLREGYASKNAEYETGISRLWERKDLPKSVAEYVELIRALNPSGQLKRYPGSPLLAKRVTRRTDTLQLFELHPADHKLLKQNFVNSKNVKIHKEDGLGGLKALLPPLSRRGITLIDPPYEHNSEYTHVVNALKDSLERFANGIYAVWYPLLQKRASQLLPQQLKGLPIESWLHVTLTVEAPSDDGFGMHGSGMFVINPPWTLLKTLQEAMPYLAEHLGQDSEAGFELEHHIP
ncbi:23S rRNA (adenine(2030)-N(6))-methyltransferase RlmJ [Pseudomonadota bacterium]